MTSNSFSTRGFRWRAIALIALLFAGAANAADVRDYHARVESALGLITQLRLLEETADAADPPGQQMIADVRRMVPPTETIDLPGSTIETDNTWLHQGLDAFAQFSDPEDRIVQIYALEERLTALDRHLSELHEANAAATIKDENKRLIAEILRRAEYQPPQEKGESLFQRWIREFTDWLAKMFPRVPALSSSSSEAGTLRRSGQPRGLNCTQRAAPAIPASSRS